MIDLTNCEIATLREDGDFVISRVKRAAGLTPWLMVSPADRQAAPASVAILANAYVRREETHPSWTAQPLELVHYEGKLSLILRDPGGECLDGLLADLRRCSIAWESESQPDLRSLSEISQAITGEIILDRLMERLMRSALELTGADRGVLVLLAHENPQIGAEATANGGRIDLTLKPVIEGRPVLAESLLQKVIRTQERVLMDDPLKGNPDFADEYVRQVRPRSILCMPILRERRLVGVLYLENHLVPGTFTPQKVAALEILIPQAAISLENARRFESLEQENLQKERVESELRRNKRLLIEGQRISGTGSWSWNLKTGKIIWSREMSRIFGLATDTGEMTFDLFLSTIHPEDRARVEKTVRKAISALDPFDHEYRIVPTDREMRYLHGSGRPMLQPSGDVEEYIGAVLDITERKHTEDKLRRSEAFLAQAQRVTQTSSLYWKPSTGEIIWSEESFRLMEYPLATIPTVALIMNRIHPEDRAQVEEMVGRSAGEGAPMNLKHRLMMADGRVKHIHIIARNISPQQGDYEFVGAVSDITEQYKAEAALEEAVVKSRESEEQLRTIINTIPTLAWRAEPDGSREFFNERWLKYTGLSKEQAEGIGWTVAVHPDDMQKLHEYWSKIIMAKCEGEIEARLRRFDGEYRWFLFRAAPCLDEQGKIVKWYGTNTDIEDLKRTEVELRRSESLLAEGEALSGTGSGAWNLLTGEMTWSANDCRMLGLDPDTTVPSVETFLGLVHPDDRAPLGEIIERETAARRPYSIEYRIVMPDGSLKDFHTLMRPIVKPSGDIEEYIGVSRDITANKRAEAELRRQEGELRKAQLELAHATRVTTMGELAASIAHEVSQPVSGIVVNAIACLKWLARGAGETEHLDEVREAVQRIIRDGKRAGEVVTRIRTLFTKEEIAKNPMDLNEAIREILALTNAEVEEKRVTLQLELAPELPAVLGDRVQLQQVMLNLILNAIEAMSTIEDRPRDLLIKTEVREPGAVLVTVRDSGPGLDAAIAGSAFAAFRTTKPGGLGMGLSISRSIVEAHSGKIWTIANDGPGATFQFTLLSIHAGADVPPV
jgi:PAS domain S-box-containing protein